jgi:hypothetical protein
LILAPVEAAANASPTWSSRRLASWTAEQKVALSEVVQERARDDGKTLRIRLYDKLSAMAHLEAKPSGRGVRRHLP